MVYRDIKSNTKRKEKVWMCSIAVILLCGVVSELIVKAGKTIIFIDDMASLTLAVISIQATVATLVITVLSLMANKMDDAFQGVSANDFLLNIKPWLFTQKRIIVAEIIGIIISVGLQVLALYNMIMAVFVATMALVLLSISQIYDAFSGTERLHEEIVAYIIDGLDEWETFDEDRYHRSLSKFEAFSKQWSDEIANQTKAEYDGYLDTFSKFFPCMYSDDDGRVKLLSACEDLSRSQLEATNNYVIIRGILFVGDCYQKALDLAQKHGYKLIIVRDGFNLLDRILEDLMEAFPSAEIANLEKHFHWGVVVDSVIQNAVNLMGRYRMTDDASDIKEENIGKILENVPSIAYDLKAVKDFSSYLGDYTASKASTINKCIWGERLDYLDLIQSCTSKSPQDVFANKTIAVCCVNFMIRQVRRGYYDVIRDYWYKGLKKSTRYQDEDEFVYSVLKLHCYIYYLAFYETTEYAEQQLIDSAKAFISEENTRKAFGEYILLICDTEKNVVDPEFAKCIEKGENVHDIFNGELKDRLYEGLRHSECMPGNGMVKSMVMSEVVMDFVTYLATYIGNILQDYTILDHIISEEKSALFYMHYVQIDRSQKLLRFFNIMEVSDTSVVQTDGSDGLSQADNTSQRADAAYAELVWKIKDNYKNHILHTARTDKRYTAEEHNQQGVKAAEDLLQYLKKRFSEVISENLVQEETGNIFKRNGYERSCILRLGIMSDTDLEKIVTNFYDRIFKVLTMGIISHLHNAGFVQEMNREGKSDEEWLNDLKSYDGDLALGAQAAFYAQHKHAREAVLDWLNGIKHYTYVGHGTAVILKSKCIKLNFKNVKFEIRPETFSEAVGSKAQPDPETGTYQYEACTGMPVQLTREELSDYLQNKRRVVDLHLDIGINVETEGEEVIGVEFVG